MKAARLLIAGVVTLLLSWSGVVSAPTATADTADPVTATVGCGYVDFQNVSSELVGVMYGDPRRHRADGYFELEASASKHIVTSRSKFVFVVLSEAGSAIQLSDILKPQACPRISGKAPKITGKPQVGHTLNATTKGWGPAGVVQLSYQWYRSGKAVPGATSAAYSLTSADKGRKISVKVTGAADGYFSLVKSSATTAKVKAGVLAPAPRPTIQGEAVVGATLTADAGVWGPTGVELSYQWYRSGKKIKGATNATYLVASTDLGKKLAVAVTGALDGYDRATRTSASTVKVVAAP